MKGSGFGLSPFYLMGHQPCDALHVLAASAVFGGVIIVRHTVSLFIFGQDLVCMAGE